LAPTLDKLADIGPLPDDITVHLDSGYDSGKTRDELAGRGLHGQIAHKGEKAPIQASQRRQVERTNAWHNAFNRLQRCYERREHIIDAFFDLADTIITVRSLIRKAWTPYGTPDQHAAHEDHLIARPLRSGGPGESHPRAPTDPYVTVSRHTALVILVTRRRGPMPSGRRAWGTGG
jgi:hypothetical protein